MTQLLLVEDSPIDAAATTRTLRKLGIDVTVATTLDVALAAVDGATWDLILCDHKLPDGLGLDLIAHIGDTPLIMVTGAGNEELAVSALKAGAADYIVKDVDGTYLKLLPATIDAALSQARVHGELRQTHEALTTQLDKLRKINTELRAFASRVSHDVRAPLRRIRTFVDFIVEEAPHLSKDASEMMDVLVGQVDELDQIIRQLLEFSRTGGEINGQVFRPVALIDRVVQTLSLEIEEVDARVEQRGFPESMYGDPTLLELVFQNLVGNALKYRAEAPPIVTIEFDGDPSTSIIRIRDNGRGIDPKEAARLFEPFFRGSHASGIRGSGLGLSTCRRIVEAHGGTINFADQEGPGTTVELRLPRRAEMLES